MDELEWKNEHVSVTMVGRVERLGRIKLRQYASHFCVRDDLPGGARAVMRARNVLLTRPA